MALYDAIGKTYAQTRKSDSRIAKKLLEILSSSPTLTVADIGAGTGSYASILAEHGYRVFAIEPSATLRNQVVAHPQIEQIDADANRLPLADRAVNAAIVMLAFHHFPNYRQALTEIHRVAGQGQIVFFTYDPTLISSFWLTEYFPSFIKDIESTFLPIPKLIEEVQRIADRVVNVIPFPLPPDLSDSFAAVGWARPELYLDDAIRKGISSFSKMSNSELESGLLHLEEDLEQGKWDCQSGHLRQQNQYDVGYRFVHRPAV